MFIIQCENESSMSINYLIEMLRYIEVLIFYEGDCICVANKNGFVIGS